MSDAVKLSGRLPGNTDDNDANGLESILEHLIAEPAEIRLALVWFDTAKITDNTDDGTRVPTVRVRRIEPLDGRREDQARKIGEAAYSARTGRKALPIPVDGDTPDDE